MFLPLWCKCEGFCRAHEVKPFTITRAGSFFMLQEVCCPKLGSIRFHRCSRWKPCSFGTGRFSTCKTWSRELLKCHQAPHSLQEEPFAEMTMALVSVMVDICSLYNQKTLRVMKKALWNYSRRSCSLSCQCWVVPTAGEVPPLLGCARAKAWGCSLWAGASPFSTDGLEAMMSSVAEILWKKVKQLPHPETCSFYSSSSSSKSASLLWGGLDTKMRCMMPCVTDIMNPSFSPFSLHLSSVKRLGSITLTVWWQFN